MFSKAYFANSRIVFLGTLISLLDKSFL